jgi:hypothetical protein
MNMPRFPGASIYNSMMSLNLRDPAMATSAPSPGHSVTLAVDSCHCTSPQLHLVMSDPGLLLEALWQDNQCLRAEKMRLRM